MQADLAFDTNLADPALIPGLKAPPYALLKAWREEDPVHWNPPNPEYDPAPEGFSLEKGFWVLTRYADVDAVSRDQALFSSYEGGPTIWDHDEIRLEQNRAGLMGMPNDIHLKAKRLIQPPFGAKALRAFEPEVERVAREIVDSVSNKGRCEFIFDVASKLPVYTFCALMGIPEALRDTVFKLGNALANLEDPQHAVEGYAPELELFAICGKLIEEKRQTPDGSMLSAYVHGDVDGEKLDALQIGMFFVTMAIAGHETTRATAAHFVRLMHEHPEQYALLRSDLDAHLPNAIDEVLRYAPPVVKFRRTAMRDTELSGRKIQKGDKVYLSYPAANRDPAVFEDPDRFDITRANAKKHLSFGVGPHICLGARLAHIQLRHLLKEIVTRIPDIRPDGAFEMLKTIWFNGIIDMPVVFTPESRKGDAA